MKIEYLLNWDLLGLGPVENKTHATFIEEP